MASVESSFQVGLHGNIDAPAATTCFYIFPPRFPFIFLCCIFPSSFLWGALILGFEELAVEDFSEHSVWILYLSA